MKSLSLTMIVRDEEALLPDCLASVRGVVDEVVVVDTGSRDATRAVATRAGARVFDFAWCDDFAAARNAALSHARGRWILVLDADERLAPGAGRALRRALSNATFDCGMLRLHDASRLDASAADVLSGRERQAEVQLVPRLLRRTDGLAFVDPIHENVMPWLRRRGMKVVGVEVDIVHLGATRDVVDAKGKIERNVRLLRARIERGPDDVTAHGYLAHDLMRAGDPDAAFEVAARGWQGVVAGAAACSSIHRVATAYAYLLIGKGRYAEARDVAMRALALEGENPDFTFFVAYACESEVPAAPDAARRAELLARARDGYQACLGFGARVFAQSFVVGARSWYGAARLGTVELLLERPAQAEQAFDKALALRPGYPLALLGKAEAVLEAGQPARALAMIEKVLDGSPDGWTLAASAALALGRADDARVFALRAAQVAGKGFTGSHRRPRLQAVVKSLGLTSTRGGSSLTARVIGEPA
jgi:glycosyltransferase involved in cell wall biosynthesis